MPCRNSLQRARNSAFLSQQHRCYYCRQPMWLGDPAAFCLRYRLTRGEANSFRCTEHLTARRDGGGDGAANNVAACLYCNTHRHKRRVPPDPASYRDHVRRRISRGRWHHPRALKAIQSAFASRT
jgi:hypothetical protein